MLPSEEEAQTKFDTDWSVDSNDWETFNADKDEAGDAVKKRAKDITGDVDATAKQAKEEAAECFNLINRFEIGQLSGKLFAHFFNNAV